MILLDMIKKTDARITDKHYTLENDILTLQLNIGDYDTTDKTITATFSPSGVETGYLDAVDGVVSLPIYTGYIEAGINYVQLNFRWGTDKLEQSPMMIWRVESSLASSGVTPDDVDIVTQLIIQANAAIDTAEALKGIDTIERTAGDGSPGTLDTYTITYTDGTTTTFQVRNGPTGPQGPQGEQGIQGPAGGEVVLDDASVATDKVWSSEKVSSELADVANDLDEHKLDYVELDTKMSYMGYPNTPILKNLISDSLMKLTNPDNWTYGKMSGTSANGILTATVIMNTSPATTVSNKLKTPIIAGHKYYVRYKIRVTNAVCSQLRFYDGTSLKTVKLNPVENEWYDIELYLLPTNSSATVTFYHYYATGDIALGKVLELTTPSIIDLTDEFGIGNEPTQVEMNKIISAYANNFIPDNASATETTKYLLNKSLQIMEQASVWSDKKIVCFGDSVTDSSSYPIHIANLIGSTVYNVGFGGSLMQQHPTRTDYDAFCMHALATAITTNNWTYQDTGALTVEPDFQPHLDLLKSIDFNTIDVITLLFGANDWKNGQLVGDPSLDNLATDNFNGAINYVLQTLLTAYPHLKILIMTPTWRMMEYETDKRGSDVTLAGVPSRHIYTDISKAIIDRAFDYKIPCYDLYKDCGWNWMTKNLYTTDGTHPTEAGSKLLGEKIASKLISTF